MSHNSNTGGNNSNNSNNSNNRFPAVFQFLLLLGTLVLGAYCYLQYKSSVATGYRVILTKITIEDISYDDSVPMGLATGSVRTSTRDVPVHYYTTDSVIYIDNVRYELGKIHEDKLSDSHVVRYYSCMNCQKDTTVITEFNSNTLIGVSTDDGILTTYR